MRGQPLTGPLISVDSSTAPDTTSQEVNLWNRALCCHLLPHPPPQPWIQGQHQASQPTDSAHSLVLRSCAMRRSALEGSTPGSTQLLRQCDGFSHKKENLPAGQPALPPPLSLSPSPSRLERDGESFLWVMSSSCPASQHPWHCPLHVHKPACP